MRMMPERGGVSRARGGAARRAVTLGARVAQEDGEAVDKVGAVERVAADADAERLANTHAGRLLHRLVRQRA